MKIATLLLTGTLALGTLAYAATLPLSLSPHPATEEADPATLTYATATYQLAQNEAGASQYDSGNAWWQNAKVRIEPQGKANNFSQTNSAAFQFHRGSNTAGGSNYTVSAVDADAKVKGYSFDLYRPANDGTEGWIEPSAGTCVYTASSTDAADAVKVNVSGIASGTAASFTVANENNQGINVIEFTVTVEDAEGNTETLTLVRNAEGIVTEGNSNKTWLSSWSDGKVKLRVGASNMNGSVTQHFELRSGQKAGMNVYTLESLEEGKFVTGYSFKFYCTSTASGNPTVTPSAGTVRFFTSTTDAAKATKVQVSGLESNSAVFKLQDGNNGGLRAANFTVTLDEPVRAPEEEPEVGENQIPLVAKFGVFNNPTNVCSVRWTRTKAPQATIVSADNGNNIGHDNQGNTSSTHGGFMLYSGRNFNIACNDPDKYIAGYSFKVIRPADGPNNDIYITANGERFTPADNVTPVEVNVTDLAYNPTANFVALTVSKETAGNAYAEIYDVVLTLADIPVIELEGDQVTLYADECAILREGAESTTWSSTVRRRNEPFATLSQGANNLMRGSADHNGYYLATGSGTSATYTLDPGDDNRYITGYTFKVRRQDAAQEVSIVAGGRTYTPENATDAIEVRVAGIPESELNNVASFVLNSVNPNQKAEIFDLVIYTGERTLPRPNFPFASSTSRIFRIPAIATVGAGTHANRLVAIGDDRHGHGADIGGRIIDLNLAISDDNGATWTAPGLFRDAEGNILSQGKAGETFEMAYGDAAVTGDRESQRILVMAVAGNIGFFGGEPGNYGVKFVSDDAGESWTRTNIGDYIKDLFKDSNYGRQLSYFFGSGRLMQSRYVKTGDYYRVYGVLSGRSTNGTVCNWVLYTDDFGDTWNVLGDVNTPAVTSSGDEPKCEELPDGSVIFSARKQGGNRNFNIFRYTDTAAGTGDWLGCVTSNLNANTANFNACDGEIMILPVRPATAAEGSPATAYIALQSYPDATGRSHITISWKLLETADDFFTTQQFVSDWDGRYLVCEGDAWYSTWTLDRNNNLAFLFERVVMPGIASLEFRTISLSDITSGAWVYADDADGAIENALTGQVIAKELEGVTLTGFTMDCAGATPRSHYVATAAIKASAAGTTLLAVTLPEEGLAVAKSKSVTFEVVKNAPVTAEVTFTGLPDGFTAVESNGTVTLTAPLETDATSITITPTVNQGGIVIAGAPVTVTVEEAPVVTEPTVTPAAPEVDEIEGVDYQTAAVEDDPETEIDETAAPVLNFALDVESPVENVAIPAAVENTEAPEEHFEFRHSKDDIATAEFVNEDGQHKIRITHKGKNGIVLISLHRKAVVEQPSAPAARTLAEEAPADDAVWKLYVNVSGSKKFTATAVALTGVIPSVTQTGRKFTVGAEVTPADAADVVDWEFVASPADAVTVTANEDGTYTVNPVKAGTLKVIARLATSADDATVTEATHLVRINLPHIPDYPWSGIEEVNAEASEGRVTVFDLTGRRLSRITAPGLYIVDGRKVMVK